MSDEDGLSWEVDPNLNEEQISERWKEIIKEMQEKGVLVPDTDAPDCMGCQEKLEEITIKLMLNLEEPPVEIDEQSFTWAKGLAQFLVSPSFFRFVDDGMAYYDARCSKCGAPVMDLESCAEPHGLKFGDMTRMAGKL